MKESLASLANWFGNRGSRGHIVISVDPQMYQEVLREIEPDLINKDTSGDPQVNGVLLYAEPVTFHIMKVGS